MYLYTAVRCKCTIGSKRQTTSFIQIFRVSGYGVGIQYERFDPVSLKKTFQTSTHHHLEHRYLKSLLNRLGMPAVAAILLCPLQAWLRPRTRRHVPVPTCHVVMASPEHDIPHYPDLCMLTSKPAQALNKALYNPRSRTHSLRCLFALRGRQYHVQQLLP